MRNRARNKLPNTKHQAPERHQTPNRKLLAAVPGSADGDSPSAADGVEYPELCSPWLALKDEPDRMDKIRHAFDLEERTAKFGEAIVRFSKRIPRNPMNNRLIDQLVGCGTSVGANYCEANASVSAKDFRCSVGRCVKEAKETKFFLRMIAASEPDLIEDGRKLYRECHELHLIFATMFRRGKR
jgi:four helix bundle protein